MSDHVSALQSAAEEQELNGIESDEDVQSNVVNEEEGEIAVNPDCGFVPNPDVDLSEGKYVIVKNKSAGDGPEVDHYVICQVCV